MVKRISVVLWKMAAQERRTSSQPWSRFHPGCTQATWSPCAQTWSISARSRLSKAR